ncbi:hypothetical protein R6Q59_002443 [Mikania micrantha]
MDSECSPHQAVTVCDHIDFRFDSNFSDRVLLIYMSSDQPFESPSAALFKRNERVATEQRNLANKHLRFVFVICLYNLLLSVFYTEELAFMELLNFMYNNNLRVTNASDVLDVLITANKYDVASCMEHCSRSLKNLSMTPESLLVYLDLPSTVLMSEAFLPLTVAARQFYVVHYKDMTKIKYEDIISLPFAGVEAILASDDLQVLSEDFVYVFVLKWAKTHFPNLSDRRAIIATRLAKYIRYPFMSRRMLKQVLTSNNFDNKFAQKVVTEAISFKAEVPHTTYIKDKNSVLNRWFVERAYEYRPIKVRLRDVCDIERFGFFLATMKEESCCFVLDFVVATRSKPGEEFVDIFKTISTCTSGTFFGNRNIFSIPWSRFIGEDSVCFIDGVLHIKVQLTKLSD